MTQVTVEQLAEVVGTPVDRLLKQLSEAGVAKADAADTVSDDEKMQLLHHLQRSHGRGPDASGGGRITLRRKRTNQISVTTTGSGRGAASTSRKTVNVEVRGKRTYVKRSALLAEEDKKNQQFEAERAEREAAERAAEEQRQAAEAERRAREQREAEEAAARKAAAEEAERLQREAAEAAERQRLEAERQAREAAAAERNKAAAVRPEPKADKQAERESGKTRYGRDELHVAKGKEGRRKGKAKARRAVAQRSNEPRHGFERPTAPVVREISVGETQTVADLAVQMAVKSAEVIKTMMGMGVMATINQVLDRDTAMLVVEEMGHVAAEKRDEDVEQKLLDAVDKPSTDAVDAVTRPPVVTIMGHVDHGKTSLLDFIRRTRVAAGEAGGITQHIGAYQVETDKGVITFLDTPGHAAFTAMRARGAQLTDIVILVVAADDGVMPQTAEAVQHARAAGVPMVVAVNKVDKPEADLDRVRNELSAHQVIPEAWGGENIFVDVSAVTGQGIDDLLDAILLQAELLELKAVERGYAQGLVVEASLDKGRGPVATVLVQSGALAKGDIVLAGTEYGRVRALFDESGNNVETAGPSTPVVVLGLSGTPNAGDEVRVVPDERTAREVASVREGKDRDKRLAASQPTKLEDVFSQIKEGQLNTVSLLVKADVQGSFEALRDAFEKLSNDEVSVKIVGGGVGGITESDVHLAAASRAMVIGFNVRADGSARRLVADQEIELHYFSVIYEAIDTIKAAVSGLLAPEVREEIIGLAEVKDVFRSPKFGAVAGCLVVDGLVRRQAPIRVLRDNVVIYEGELESLRRFKDDVNEVRMGTECGIAVRNYNDVKAGDQIEVYERTEIARSI